MKISDVTKLPKEDIEAYVERITDKLTELGTDDLIRRIKKIAKEYKKHYPQFASILDDFMQANDYTYKVKKGKFLQLVVESDNYDYIVAELNVTSLHIYVKLEHEQPIYTLCFLDDIEEFLEQTNEK